ncbi:hypothetical protein Tco_0109751 [Tanacetum coccineum]
MMLLAKAITQHYTTPTNNHLSNGSNATVQQVPRTSANSRNTQNVQCYICNEKGYYAMVYPKLWVPDSNYFKEQMMLAKKDEAGIDLNTKENDFLLADVPNSEELEELNATCIIMARIQSINNDFHVGPSNDSDFANEFMGTIRFGNDHLAGIISYGYYICDGDLEVAFHLNTCYIWSLEGDDILIGSLESNFYTISISKMAASSPVCLMSKASSMKSTRKIMETIHVKFDELTTMASDRDNLEPDSNRRIFEVPSAKPYQTPSKENLDDLFGPLYYEYFKGRTPNVSTSDNSTTPDTFHYTSSSTTIIINAFEAPQIVFTYIEQTPPHSTNIATQS